ncbi:MAG: hypothetical protein AAFY76_02200 [Cyanobacteria bacterium J06649_11]
MSLIILIIRPALFFVRLLSQRLLVCGDRERANQSSKIVSYPFDGASLFLGSRGTRLSRSRLTGLL